MSSRSTRRLQRPALFEMWRWQMSNYRSDIHVSHLRPAWPAISPADAGCERRELRLSIQASGKAAWPTPTCHPSPVPLCCRSCVTPRPRPARSLPLCLAVSDRWPHWGRSGGMIKYRSETEKRQPSCFTVTRRGTEKAPFLHRPGRSDIFINKQLLMPGGGVVQRHTAACLSC